MKRSKVVIVLSIAVVVLVVILLYYRYSNSGVKHVVIITLDTTRADHLSCYGYPKKTTPNIDTIASQGILYENMFAHAPLTLPMHCTIMTGLGPASDGVHLNNFHRLTSDKATLAELFLARKYRTAAFISSFILNRRFGIAQGFQMYQDSFKVSRQGAPRLPVERQAKETGTEALKWMKGNRHKRFFLWVHFYDPHFTYDPPEPYKSAFKENLYDGEIAYADFWVGKIWEQLKKQSDDYLFIVTADHGDSFGEHEEVTHGFFAYQSTLKIPLIIEGTRVPKGQRIAYPVRSVDIAPTVCVQANLQVLPEMEGINLLSTENTQPELPVYQESWTPTDFNWCAITAWVRYPWKFIDLPKPELYNLKDDPYEKHNRIAEGKDNDTVQKLKTELQEYLKERAKTAKVTAMELDPQTIEQLRSLGYITGKITVDEVLKSIKQADPKDKIKTFKKYQFAESAISEKKYDAAIKVFKEIEQEEPALPKVHLDLAQAYQEVKKFDEALKEATVVSKLEPNLPDPLVVMGEIELKKENPSACITHFKQAVEKAPRDIYIRARLGEICASQKEFKDAEKYLGGALQFSPNNPYVLNNLGYVFIMRDNDFKKGIALIKKADKLRPDEGLIKESLGWALYRYGKYDDAVTVLEKARQLLGNQRRLIEHLKDAYTAVKMPDKVKEMSTILLQIQQSPAAGSSEKQGKN